VNRRTLGRGLSALLGNFDEPEQDENGAADPQAGPSAGVSLPQNELPISLIDPNPYQPRQEFDPAELEGLADSVKTHGVLQPVVVRQVGQRYQLVAGERRLRAVQILGWHRIPVRVIEIDDQQTCELALVENLQRKDLNAIEKAQAFERYLSQYRTTHDKLAKQLGIDRSTVTNLIRLLELPDAVQQMVAKNQISAGHARAILSVEDPLAQLTLAQEVVDKGLSVRETERLTRESRTASALVAEPAPIAEEVPAELPERSNHIVSIENELKQKLGLKVEIRAKGEAGQMVLHFASHDDFDRLLDQLRR
jgi:ParB family transcriptional regulator, chromosome partitioning protein